jgi:electron transfer DM13
MNRIWRSIAIFVTGGVLGTGLGVAIGFFIFPYVFPPPAATEQLAASERTKVVASGTFIHANPSDPVHYGKGRVSVYERTVFLEPDFEVGPGPAFHVYLVPKASIRSSSDMKDVMFVDLGGLRAFAGSQRYPIPAGVDLRKYQSVIIWCERFSVLISPADLTTAVTAR